MRDDEIKRKLNLLSNSSVFVPIKLTSKTNGSTSVRCDSQGNFPELGRSLGEGSGFIQHGRQEREDGNRKQNRYGE